MTWYLLQDTTKLEIGTVSNDVYTDSSRVTVVTTVRMREVTGTWIDSTVAERRSLRPVYHSSYNSDRDMIIRFDSLITGYYEDKRKRSTMAITDSVQGEFFDSNLYPSIIRWLPLKTGFTKDLAIYDYNPKGKTGVMKVSIICVRQCDYLHNNSTLKKVYQVTVKDDISNGFTTYFIDVDTRKLWKLIIAVGERKMVMEAA